MSDLPSWNDPSTWIGGTGVVAVVAAAAKALLDWRKDRTTTRASSEDMVRNDLIETRRDDLLEVRALRAELATARAEMRASDVERRVAEESARAAIRACEERAEKFLADLRTLHRRNDVLQSRIFRLDNRMRQIRSMVDLERSERELPPMPWPAWLDEPLPDMQSPERPTP